MFLKMRMNLINQMYQLNQKNPMFLKYQKNHYLKKHRTPIQMVFLVKVIHPIHHQ